MTAVSLVCYWAILCTVMHVTGASQSSVEKANVAETLVVPQSVQVDTNNLHTSLSQQSTGEGQTCVCIMVLYEY